MRKIFPYLSVFLLFLGIYTYFSPKATYAIDFTPSGLSASNYCNGTDSMIEFTWNRDRDSIGYNYYDYNWTFWMTGYPNPVGVNDPVRDIPRKVNVTDDPDGTTYTWRIKASDKICIPFTDCDNENSSTVTKTESCSDPQTDPPQTPRCSDSGGQCVNSSVGCSPYRSSIAASCSGSGVCCAEWQASLCPKCPTDTRWSEATRSCRYAPDNSFIPWSRVSTTDCRTNGDVCVPGAGTCTGTPLPDPDPDPTSYVYDCNNRSTGCNKAFYPECIDAPWSYTFNNPTCSFDYTTCPMENKIGGPRGDKTKWTRSCAARTKSALPDAEPIIKCEGEDDTSCPYNRICVDTDGDGKFACEVKSPENTKQCTPDDPATPENEAAKNCLSGICGPDNKCVNNGLIAFMCEKRSNDNYSCKTAIGRIDTNPEKFVQSLLRILLGLAGGILLILIIINGYKIMTSQGDPEKLKDAKEGIIAAIAGILLIIFSLSILQLITVDIIGIPGFG